MIPNTAKQILQNQNQNDDDSDEDECTRGEKIIEALNNNNRGNKNETRKRKGTYCNSCDCNITKAAKFDCVRCRKPVHPEYPCYVLLNENENQKKQKRAKLSGVCHWCLKSEDLKKIRLGNKKRGTDVVTEDGFAVNDEDDDEEQEEEEQEEEEEEDDDYDDDEEGQEMLLYSSEDDGAAEEVDEDDHVPRMMIDDDDDEDQRNLSVSNKTENEDIADSETVQNNNNENMSASTTENEDIAVSTETEQNNNNNYQTSVQQQEEENRDVPLPQIAAPNPINQIYMNNNRNNNPRPYFQYNPREGKFVEIQRR